MTSKNWKLELKYGRLKTPYQHFVVIADGVAGALTDGFECRKGPAFMSMKAWATDADEATEMASSIGGRIGFEVQGRVYVYDSDPVNPPRDTPFAYDISFKPYDE